MRIVRFTVMAFLGTAAAACGGDDSGPGLEDFYPTLPPTGGAQVAFAGEITSANTNELLTGPAAQGQVGDFFLRNDKVRVVVSAPTRVIGVVPQGGNIMDAAEIGPGGAQLHDDHFGELSMIYKAGRTCEHTSMEIVRDGAEGGPAVLRAVGKSGNNDFINLKGIGVLPVGDDLDPDVVDELACATTYVLNPGARHVEVYWSIFNAGDLRTIGPLGMLNDTGGETEQWANGRGFERAGIEALSALTTPAPIDYVVYQGPAAGYGLIPRFDTPTVCSGFLIAGVSIVLFGADNLLDIFDPETYVLELDPNGGKLQRVDVLIARDGEDADAFFRSGNGLATDDIGGTVAWADGAVGTGARVGVFRDVDGNGSLEETDVIVSYMDVAADGTYAGKVPQGGGLLVRAEVKDVSRSAAAAAGADVALSLPAAVRLDYSVIDDGDGNNIPARILVMGTHNAFPDKRLFETYDRLAGVVRSVHSIHGTTSGGVSDPAIMLPAGGPYRVYATRGTEWSLDSDTFAGTANGGVTLNLRRVMDTTGYLATEFHVHQINSPDSPVGSVERVRSAVSAGVELFAVTDHDVVSDLQPFVQELAVDDLLRVMPGIEVTPFAYGHFNAFPMNREPNSNGGAVDWGRGREGFAMVPSEIFGAMRQRGARVVQINHPRGEGALGVFQQFFDRANVTYDYGNRTIFGDFENIAVPNDWLRLPGESLWSDSWNALEVWNGFTMKDTDGDGRNENTKLDRVMRDWFNLLSLGFYVAPIGSSDTHSSHGDPVGMPRTMVRVPDDSAGALISGAAVDTVMNAVEGNSEARDIVVTNGPMIAVTANAMPAIGRQVPATGGTVTLSVTVTSPEWADIDTLEIFANDTPATPLTEGSDVVSLQPLKCFTSRPLGSLAATDPCRAAVLAPEAMTITTQTVAPGNAHRFFRATVTVTLDAADVARITRAGATGTDAWLVFRVRGDKAIFPVLTNGVVDDQTLPVLVSGTAGEVDLTLRGRGVHACAFTAPVFVDFDGGGYRAPFQP